MSNNFEKDQYKESLSSSALLICWTTIYIHVFFVVEDLISSQDLFWTLQAIKIIAIAGLLAIIALIKKPFGKRHCELLLLVVLALIQSSVFFHAVFQDELTLIPFASGFAVIFSASILPWSLRWHLRITAISASIIVLAHYFLSTAPFWPIPKVQMLSLVFCVSSIAIAKFTAKQRAVLTETANKLRESEQEAMNLADRLERLANTDYLTGVGNLRHFHTSAENLISESQGTGMTIGLALIDLDRFKAINDSHGHAVGDEVLKHFAKICQQNIPKNWMFARVGGEEFSLIVPNIENLNFFEKMDTLRQQVKEAPFLLETEEGQQEIIITLSMGLSEVRQGESAITNAMRRADYALYKAKDTGRDRVILWDKE